MASGPHFVQRFSHLPPHLTGRGWLLLWVGAEKPRLPWASLGSTVRHQGVCFREKGPRGPSRTRSETELNHLVAENSLKWLLNLLSTEV